MIDYAQALERLQAHSARQDGEVCPLSQALGRTLAQAVVSPIDLPSFDQSAMDGYALYVRDGSSLPAGSEHEVRGSQAAGVSAGASQGMAREIMTGAPLPPGLNAVITVEQTRQLATHDDGLPARIRLLDALPVDANVRRAGSDVTRASQVAATGTRLTPAHIMLLAALGVTHVTVTRVPTVAIICTGKELRANEWPADKPQVDTGQPLMDGQIHNSNGPYLSAALTAMGVRVVACATVDDTAATYVQAVQRAHAAGADVIISTGAVSMGRYDFIPDTLHKLGAELLFHKVAIRPGKPILAAWLDHRLQDHRTLVLALPGNPMAVAAGFRFFVAPVLQRMLGQGCDTGLRAALDAPQYLKPSLRYFLRATLLQDAGGQIYVHVLKPQESFRIRPFVEAGVWAVLPEGAAAGYCVGTLVDVFSLQPGLMPSVTQLSPAEA